MKTKLSVNINKVALIRNARGDNYPNLLKFAKDCEEFGAQGITVHPRPDERHVRFSDLLPLKEIVQTEFNIEGYPSENFISKVLDVKPHQCTLVPDAPDALTSNHGWNTKEHLDFLRETVAKLQGVGTRVSLFLNADEEMVSYAKETGTDRVEFYTGDYARNFEQKELAIKDHKVAATKAVELDLGINAGHDLNLDNLNYYVQNIYKLKEVSIGHALITDSLYYGIKNTIQMYLHQIAK